MKDLSLLQPVIVQAFLTIALLFLMAGARLSAIRAGTVDMGAPGERPKFSGRAGTLSNAFHNQFEMPMLFFAAAAFAILSEADDWEMRAFAWAFVFFRIVHAAIFVTYNYIPHRFLAYLASNVALIAMWVNLALTVFLGW